MPCLAVICVITCWLSVSFADVGMDIRSDGVLIEGHDEIAYMVAIEDCSELISISVSAGDMTDNVSSSDTKRIAGSLSGCELQFSGTGDDRFNPQITLNFRDGSSQIHSEVFQAEKNAPQLTFEGVSLASIEGHQYLVVSARAQDDVDITYVGFSVTGLRASDLRAAGGVVAHARKNAFAATEGFERVYPAHDGQVVTSEGGHRSRLSNSWVRLSSHSPAWPWGWAASR